VVLKLIVGNDFSEIESWGLFWSSTLYAESSAWFRNLFIDYPTVQRSHQNQINGFSVRCLLSEYIHINQAPDPSSNPDPLDGTQNVSFVTISFSWECSDPEGDPLTYVLFIWTDEESILMEEGMIDNNYIWSDIDDGTFYLWKIFAHDNNGNSTESPDWSFITECFDSMVSAFYDCVCKAWLHQNMS